MHACETMGATTVICTDKTGTLTQNKMQVKECTFGKLTPELAEGIAVNSTASLDFSESQPRPIGNPTEGALLLWLHTNKYDYRRLKEASNTKNEIPFSTERKYMSTTVFSAVTNREVTYTKGAPEIVFGMCDSSDIDEVTLKESLQKYQDSAYRTLGFAIDKHFVGVVAIEDPVREDVPDAVKECMNAGIMVKIVTGDTPGTAKQIGREIGLWADADTDRNIITGTELAELSDEKLQECVLDLKIIARARPMDKKRLVEALQARNQVVAVTGDGLLVKNNKSLYLYDFRQNKISEFASVISKELQNNVKSFYVDSLDRLWILTKENRLFSYDKNTKLKEYKDVKLLLLKDDSPQIFYSDPMGNIWLGYIDNLYRISFTSDHEIDEVESIHQNVMFDSCGISKIRAMYWDSRTSSMFVGTDVQGMYQLYIDRQKPIKDIKIEHYMFDKGDKHSLSSNFVSSIIRDKSGILWFGTEQGGLCRAIEEDGQRMKFISYSEEDGLSNNVVKSLLGDKSGNLWIATNIGLNIYRNDSGSFHVYRTSDGLPFDDFWYASFMMNDGTLVFSKFEGFCYFNPDLLPNKEELPQLHIRSFNVLSDKILPNEIYNDRIIIDSRLSDNDVLNLKYNENSISFDIDALYSKVATDHFIRYKLEPLNDEWIQIPAKDQKLSFNGLKPDNYRLSLSASNSFDEWTKPISIGINIAPPFSRSAIAYVIYVLLALLFISIIVYNLMRVQRLKYELREEAIQKRSLELLNIEKQRFFSNISHELKTPLTLILAPITVLSERFLLDIDVKEKLAIIKRQAKKMLNLIELSHELQLNERNMLKVKPCMFSFNKFLKDITEDFMFMAKYDNKDFVVNYPNKNVNVYADYSMIEQMLNNLLTNSFKHTVQRDKVGIDISYHDQLLTIKVYDTGDGISEKDLPYIFDRFYQASNQGLKNIGGTGIGLAFTKRLIELHSGNIGVESKLGEGSTFTVNLPIIQNVTEADVIDETNEQEGETDLYVGDWDIKSIEIDSKYLRFLVYLVEDNTEMRSFLTEIIGQFFTVKSFANGKECLDGMNKEWPDIIVSDVMMPEMDGNELCNVIKSDLKTSHIPVILLTACNTVDDKIKGLQSGADAYIPKPFYPKHVLTRICTLLDNRAKLWERFQSGVPLNIAANENEVSAKDNEFICALYAKFNEYVDDECVDMELLAKEIGVNRSLFFQKVKALTNDSPFELLKNYRLQRAAELLVKEEYNVNEVCMMTGFKSRTHFSRLFKEKYGVAPSKYKESVVNRI